MIKKHIKEFRSFCGKFRKGTLTLEEALGGYAISLTIGPFLTMSAVSVFFIDTEIDWTDDRRIVVLKILFFILFFFQIMILLSRSLPQQAPILIWIFRILGAIVTASICAFMSIGDFVFWNTMSGSGETVLVNGPIVRMEVGTGGRLMSKPYFINIHYEGRDIKLTVPSEEYATLSPGQTYSREMKLGGLGYYYNWGSSWWK